MKQIWLAFTLISALLPTSIRAQMPADSGTFLLHKFEQRIGKETYRVIPSAQALTYDVRFRFVDRGMPVPLRANITVKPSGEPLSLGVSGNTSRFSTIKDSIQLLAGGTSAYVKVSNEEARTLKLNPSTPHFPVAGYSPATGQMLLLRYWKQHKEPASLDLLPSGTVRIRRDGQDTLTFQNKPLVLQRYVLKGLVWGNELLWTDQQDRLVCIITNDAEGDKIEMLALPYEALLPTLIGRAATHGMRLFTTEVGAEAKAKTAAKPRQLAFVGGTVVDVVQGRTIPNAVVLVDGGKITQVGPATKVKVPKQAQVIRAEGKTIVPGLWDMHAHFQQAEWGPAYLAAGVTTVRDCGNEFSYINAVQQAIDAGRGVGPHILKAGVIDGEGPTALGIVRANTPAEAAQVVQRYQDNGFVQIKIYSSVKPEMVQTICQEAHKRGMTVTGHIPEGMTILQGVAAGMDQVNHIPYVAKVLKRNADKSYVVNDTTSARIYRFLKEHHTVIDPTLGAFEMTDRPLNEDITTVEPAFTSLPQPLQALFLTMGAEPERVAQAKLMMESSSRLVKQLYDHGITIVAGTDMGFPGTSLARELELYVHSGLTPMQALQTATITPARVMKLAQRTGSLDPGKQADLLLIDGNPLQQIRDIRRVQLVVKDGQLYEPARMRQLADFQK
jgi:imidazolonepropionase-like amidohydrolase